MDILSMISWALFSSSALPVMLTSTLISFLSHVTNFISPNWLVRLTLSLLPRLYDFEWVLLFLNFGSVLSFSCAKLIVMVSKSANRRVPLNSNFFIGYTFLFYFFYDQ